MSETYDGNKQENNKPQDLLSIKLNRVSTKEQKKKALKKRLRLKKRQQQLARKKRDNLQLKNRNIVDFKQHMVKSQSRKDPLSKGVTSTKTNDSGFKKRYLMTNKKKLNKINRNKKHSTTREKAYFIKNKHRSPKEIDHALLGIKKRQTSSNNIGTNQRSQLSTDKINKQKLGSKKFYHKKQEKLDKNILNLAGIKNTLTATKQTRTKKLEEKLFGIKDKLERKHQVLSNSNKIKRLKKQTKIPSKKKFKPKLKKNLAQTAIDTVGRNKDGELNILGVLLVLFIILKLILMLLSVKVMMILAVVIVVIVVIIAIFNFIASIFTIKTEDMALAEAYEHITLLDARKNKEVQRVFEDFSENSEIEEVYFVVNGVARPDNNFIYSSDADTYLYYLNAKYEDYNISKRISASSNIFGATRVRGEVEGIHGYTFNYTTEIETREVPIIYPDEPNPEEDESEDPDDSEEDEQPEEEPDDSEEDEELEEDPDDSEEDEQPEEEPDDSEEDEELEEEPDDSEEDEELEEEPEESDDLEENVEPEEKPADIEGDKELEEIDDLNEDHEPEEDPEELEEESEANQTNEGPTGDRHVPPHNEEDRPTHRTIKVALINIEIKTISQFIDENSDTMSEEELDKFGPIQELDRFENKLFLQSPFGMNQDAIVVQKYGYRGSDDRNRHNHIELLAQPGTPVYGIDNSGSGRVHAAGNDYVTINTSLSKRVVLSPLKNVRVRNGEWVDADTLVGETTGNLKVEVIERRTFWPNRHIYPSAYIFDLEFQYPSEIEGFTHNSSRSISGSLKNPGQMILQWEHLVREACEKYGIPEYVNMILAIIQVESGGDAERFPDIMQASESQGLSPNTIDDPELSIDRGTHYFAQLLSKARELHLDDRAALQAYNYGEDFLNWLANTNKQYSFFHAELYAREKSNRQTVRYTHPVALAHGFSWRYAYGNMFYVPIVTNYLWLENSDFLEAAINEIGTIQGEKYWQWYGFEGRVEWCAIFVSWVADQVGYLNQEKIIKSANCLEMINWLTEKGNYKKSSENYHPQPGDLIFFDWNGGGTGKDHVGIVEFSDGNIIQTIEGNTANKVARRTYFVNDPSISGYGILQ
ncbi:lysozyme family protein [Enterococcus mundtii]|uniref:CHAP domain-containing protein n=1 Tax=Enterococcus mundtii TaxID=53346 RepID=A0A848MZF7_ENTMU|nr:lysozyme family protein [Enterococcus mundtii]NMP59378.1 CHAP domain-containing protein [Enterococcus mundtii]